MEFQVKTTLGQKEILAYQRITGKTVQRVKMNVLHWGLVGLGLVGLTASGAALATVQGGAGSLLGLALSTICFVWGINWYRYLVWKVGRRLPADFQQEFLFGEDGMLARSVNEKVSHRYGAIYALAESQDYFVLFLHKGAGYILDKQGFEVGSPEEFATHIQEKTGKQISRVTL